MTTTLSIHRDSLSLPALAITGSRATTTSGMWIPDGGIAWPAFEPRYRYAPDSAYEPGRTLLAVVLEQALLPAVIRVTGDDATELAARRAELEAAVSQFSFQLDLDIDGQSGSWQADFTWPTWAPPTPSTRLDLTERASLTFPINP
jgi:hypothetical protein